ncbi:MAG: peroxiredoxin [Candidatus Pelagibacter sp. TMED165]|nr:MAG: peroxiredoxin [Candidatus Pelagibacter sp. TMED165]|tara:strand:+ start:235 stop:723 length:489 start_codon:yes stop_codon:yes gene_type:complete
MKIKVGDKLPHAELFFLDQNNNVKQINILELCKNNKTLILGMPGAFTKTCSALHLPGYVKNYNLALKKGITKLICIAVNDPNVMKAWGENQNTNNKILMVGDPFLKFTKSIGAEVDKSAKGLGLRSNRYTMLVEDSIVKKIEEEKETATCELSSAESFLNTI